MEIKIKSNSLNNKPIWLNNLLLLQGIKKKPPYNISHLKFITINKFSIIYKKIKIFLNSKINSHHIIIIINNPQDKL